MSRGKGFTTTELKEIREYLDSGCNYDEIAELTGRSHGSIRNCVSKYGMAQKRTKPKKVSEITESFNDMKTEFLTPKEKTLKDFSPREMIKYLYDMGYRIKNNQLVCTVEQVVNLKDIING